MVPIAARNSALCQNGPFHNRTGFLTLTFDNTLGSEKHHHRQSAREDHVLSRVQECERSGDLDRGLFVCFQSIIELFNFVFLIVEVLQNPKETSLVEMQCYHKYCIELLTFTAS
jgi:hypothetical protein